MFYRVYLWKSVTSQEAEVVQAVQALSADAAIEQVMQAGRVPYANYVWVVPDDEEMPCVERTRVRCASVRRAGH